MRGRSVIDLSPQATCNIIDADYRGELSVIDLSPQATCNDVLERTEAELECNRSQPASNLQQ